MAQCIVRFRGACALAPHKSMAGADLLSVVLPDGETQHEYKWPDGAGGEIKATPKPHHAALLLPLALGWTVKLGAMPQDIKNVIHACVTFPANSADTYGVIYLDRQDLAFNQTGTVNYGKFAGLGKVAAVLNPKAIQDAMPPSSVRARVRFEAGQLKGDDSEGASKVSWTIHSPGQAPTTAPSSYFMGAQVEWTISSPLTLTVSPFAGGDALTFSVMQPAADVVIFVRNLEFPHVIGLPAPPGDPCDRQPDFDFALLYELQKGSDDIAVPHPEPCDEEALHFKAGGGKAARCMVGFYAQ